MKLLAKSIGILPVWVSVKPTLRSSAATADSYALMYAAPRHKCKPVPTNDLWIAASSLEHGTALLTHDAHYQNIDGLRAWAQLEDFIP